MNDHTRYYLESANKARNELTEAIKKFESLEGWGNDKIELQKKIARLREKYFEAIERLHLNLATSQKETHVN